MNRHVVVIITTFGLLGPGALSAASASTVHSPDARDANIAARSSRSAQGVDLRSPDARDAARQAVPQVRNAPVDLRSPDTRDAADGVRLVSLPPASVGARPGSHAFEWGDASLGAGGAVALAVLAFGVGVSIRHHRRRVRGGSRTPLAY